MVTLAAILLVLAIILGLAGFAVKFLFWVAIILLIAAAVSFFVGRSRY